MQPPMVGRIHIPMWQFLDCEHPPSAPDLDALFVNIEIDERITGAGVIACARMAEEKLQSSGLPKSCWQQLRCNCSSNVPQAQSETLFTLERWDQGWALAEVFSPSQSISSLAFGELILTV